MQRLPTDGDDPRQGVLLGLAGLVAVAVLLGPMRTNLSPALPALLLVAAVVVAGGYGGPRVGGALGGTAAMIELFLFVSEQSPRATVVEVIESVVLVALFMAIGIGAGWLAQISESTELEVELASGDNAALSRRLVSVTVERAVLAEEAEDLAEREVHRTALLRSVSHDLRTPLSAIRAVATDLRDGVQYENAVRVDLLSTVCDEVERLDQMVANLLSMSRIEADRLHPQPQVIDLIEVVNERFRSLSPLFRSVRTRSSFAADLPLIEADFVMLQELLTNLLGNASRHAPADTEVWVVAERFVERDDGHRMMQIEVSDQGRGVADDFLPKLFEPFCRGEGSRSTGLGLAICKAMVEAHGGTIWTTRTFGGGATFCFTLPVFTDTGTEPDSETMVDAAPAEMPT